MKKSLYILGAFAFLMSACTSDIEENAQGQDYSLVATFEQNEDGERTVLGQDEEYNKVLWQSGDEISVTTVVGNNIKFTTTDAGARATFKGKTIGAPTFAMYPYQEDATISGNIVTMKVPATQTYQENSFGRGANIAGGGVYANRVMFKNMLGMLKLQLLAQEGQDIKVGKIILTDKVANFPLNGTYRVDVSKLPKTEEDIDISTIVSYAGGGTNTLTLDCSADGGVALSSTDSKAFYIAVPNGALSQGFTAQVYDTDNVLVQTIETTKANTITRSKVKVMPVKTVEAPAVRYVPVDYLQSTGEQYINTGIDLKDLSARGNIIDNVTKGGQEVANGYKGDLRICITASYDAIAAGSAYGCNANLNECTWFVPFSMEPWDATVPLAMKCRIGFLSYINTPTDVLFDKYAPFTPVSPGKTTQEVHLDYSSTNKTFNCYVWHHYEDQNTNFDTYVFNKIDDPSTLYWQMSQERWAYLDDLYLFAVNTATTFPNGWHAADFFTGKIYNFNIKRARTDEVLYNFQPVIKKEYGKADKPGMLETVHNVFYPNEGSGADFNYPQN